MLKGYVQCVICMKQQQKWRHVMKTGKHKILFNKKAHLTRKVLWNCEPNYQQKLEQVETKIKKLYSANVVQFPFGQPSHKSFWRNVELCWGSWPCLPPISLGWVVVGVWTEMIGQLEGTSLESFLSICSSKLEASQAFVQRLQPFLKMDATASTLFIFNAFRSKLGVVDS